MESTVYTTQPSTLRIKLNLHFFVVYTVAVLQRRTDSVSVAKEELSPFRHTLVHKNYNAKLSDCRVYCDKKINMYHYTVVNN